jgi:hypothetical protein
MGANPPSVNEGASQEAGGGEAEEPVAGHDDMVIDRQVEEATRLDQLAGDRPVLGRGGGIAAGVIVSHDDPGRGLGNCRPEDLPRMDQGAVEQAPGNENIPDDPGLAVEGEEVELLNRQVPEPGTQQGGHIGGITNGGEWPSLLLPEARGQLEGRHQPRRLRGAHPEGPGQLGRRTGGEPTQGSTAAFEESGGEGHGVAPGRPGSEQDGEEFGRRESGSAERPETFAGSVRGRDGGHAGSIARPVAGAGLRKTPTLPP